MGSSAYDLHVFGLNFSGLSSSDRAQLALKREEIALALESLAETRPEVEAVVLRARNHVEAFLAAPVETDLVRTWVGLLRRFRPDLLHDARRPLHYHLVGPGARMHLLRITGGQYAQDDAAATVHAGVKDSLALAARCGTLGETLDGLFIQGLESGRSTTATPQDLDFAITF